MVHKGSCHCGRIAFEVEGDVSQVMECNCSHCSRKGYLLWFIPKQQLKLATPEANLSTYMFNKHVIAHHFCGVCGCAPFGFGKDPKGQETAAINVRCLPDLDRSKLEVMHVDGRNK
ncbi:MAG: GFA family protein [Methylocella sp.]